ERQRLRKWIVLQVILGIAHVASNRRAVQRMLISLHPQHCRGDVFASNVPVHAIRLAVNALCLAKQKSSGIENMGADVGENESLQLRKKRLICEHRKSGGEVNAGPEYFADSAVGEHLAQGSQRHLPS